MTDIVQKLWGFCHTLRHDGVDYGDYIEQITYLLFIKMADERAVVLPKGCDWPTLAEQSGTALVEHYGDLLRKLGQQPGILGDIYAKSQNRFNNPVNLKRLINLIAETEWTSLDVDVKAQAYEGLLEKAASEGKKGAGQYFTPRVLIQSIVHCMKPDPRVRPDFSICDPACGTGGFLVAAYEWLMANTKGGALDRDLAKRIKKSVYRGQELVERPRRLALMNLYLHGIEPKIVLGDTIYEAPSSALFALADRIEARVRAATARVEKITQSILAKAFRGELVPTEAALACQEGCPYETATALIARLRTQREEPVSGSPHCQSRKVREVAS